MSRRREESDLEWCSECGAINPKENVICHNCFHDREEDNNMNTSTLSREEELKQILFHKRKLLAYIRACRVAAENSLRTLNETSTYPETLEPLSGGDKKDEHESDDEVCRDTMAFLSAGNTSSPSHPSYSFHKNDDSMDLDEATDDDSDENYSPNENKKKKRKGVDTTKSKKKAANSHTTTSATTIGRLKSTGDEEMDREGEVMLQQIRDPSQSNYCSTCESNVDNVTLEFTDEGPIKCCRVCSKELLAPCLTSSKNAGGEYDASQTMITLPAITSSLAFADNCFHLTGTFDDTNQLEGWDKLRAGKRRITAWIESFGGTTRSGKALSIKSVDFVLAGNNPGPITIQYAKEEDIIVLGMKELIQVVSGKAQLPKSKRKIIAEQARELEFARSAMRLETVVAAEEQLRVAEKFLAELGSANTDRKRFLQQFCTLCRFATKEGHTNMPCSVSNYWNNQRAEYKMLLTGKEFSNKKSRMTQEKIELLEEINFDWSVQEGAFHDKMSLLEHFININGHALVPSTDPTIGNWVSKLRSSWKKNNLPDDREQMLRGVGFLFDPSNDIALATLQKYKQLHGHCFHPYYNATKSKALKQLSTRAMIWLDLFFEGRLQLDLPHVYQELVKLDYERFSVPRNHFYKPENRPEIDFFYKMMKEEGGIECNGRDDKIVEELEIYPDGAMIINYASGRTILHNTEYEESRHDDRTIFYQQRRALSVWLAAKKLGIDGVCFWMVNGGDCKVASRAQAREQVKALKQAFKRPQEYLGMNKRYRDFPVDHFHPSASQKRVIQQGDKTAGRIATAVEHAEEDSFHFYSSVTIEPPTEGFVPGI